LRLRDGRLCLLEIEKNLAAALEIGRAFVGQRDAARGASRTRSFSSSRDTALLTPDTEICSFWAAAVRLALSPTATKIAIALRLSVELLAFAIALIAT
jgi:hypothetical protein